ncbi:MAG: WGR domain-containing protein [Alphaproteobacteria bacterium]|nr:WGR domain-containing protein [Alphaproteobacteria bacterium]MCB9794339.1 WGR domain-containing protein [Alphaproteobacteria bacterium]
MSDPFYSQYLVSQSTSGGKFWEVEVEGLEMRIRYGKIGQDKAWSAQSFDSHEAAVKAAEKKAASKRSKGYAVVERQSAVHTQLGGDFASRPLEGVVYFRALDRYPGGNADMWVIKISLSYTPGQPMRMVCRMVGNWDGSRWATGDKEVELDTSVTGPAFLAAAERLAAKGLLDTNDSILDTRYDREEYDTEWSSIECELTAWPTGAAAASPPEDGRTALRVVQRALSYTKTCSPPAPETAAFIEALQALVGIGRIEAFSDGGSSAHYGPSLQASGHGPLPLYL